MAASSLRLRRSRLLALAAAGACGVLAPSVAAHPVIVYAAQATVAAGDVEVSLSGTDHDLEHAGFGRGGQATVDRFAAAVASELTILDGQGRRAVPSVRAASQGPSGAGFDIRLRYRFPESDGPRRFITFQLRPAPGGATARTQIQIAFQSPAPAAADSAKAPRLLRLSSGGNPETVDLDSSNATLDPLAARMAPLDDPLKTIWLVERDRVHAAPLRLTLVLPAHLLVTWLPLDRAGADALTSAELHAAAPAVASWAIRAVRFESAGDPLAAKAAGVRLLPPSAAPTANSVEASAPVGFWCARVAVDIEAPPGPHPAVVWTAFNGAVQTVNFLAADGSSGPVDAAAGFLQLTSYSPRVQTDGTSWRAAAPSK